MSPFQLFLLADALFAIGIFGVITRKNAIGILMSVELILNGVNLNLINFSRNTAFGNAGQIFALFVILLAALEAALGIAIIIGIYRSLRSIDVDEARTLKG